MAAKPKVETIPIAYVGKKDRQDDPVAATGLVWTPGDVHHVTREQAAILLNHPDVWADDRSPGAQKKVPIEPHAPPKPQPTEDEAQMLSNMAPLIDIGVMDVDGLTQYGMREFGLALDPALDVAAMRAEIQSKIDGQKFN